MSYNPEKFWEARLATGINNPCAAGRMDRSAMFNWELFAKSAVKVHQVLSDFKGVGSLLEVGVGNGFFIPFLSAHAENYTGCDITDVNFKSLWAKYDMNLKLQKVDICGQLPTDWDNSFHTIVMLDVEQHITDGDKWLKAMENIKRIMSKEAPAYFICTTWNSELITPRTDYEVARPFYDYQKQFDSPEFHTEIVCQYRDKCLFVAERLQV
jgi:hypothetical protein